MTMRANLERDTQTATDLTGAKNPPKWTSLNPELPCYLYRRLRPTRHIDGNKTATVEDLILWAPIGTDVKAGDRINGVVDRLGAIEHATPLKVRGRQLRKGIRKFIELTLIDSST